MWEKKLSQKTSVEIDAAALRHNLGVFQKLAGSKTAVMAVVKANAYGHGLLEVAKILATFEKLKIQNSKLWFGVDSLDEALLIRNLKIKNPILILSFIPPERLEEVIANDISFSVYSKELLEMIAKKQWAKKPRMHIKIETGTNRLGMRFEELAKSAPLLKKHTDWIEGIYTHFADTENPQSSFWKEQVARFEEAVALFKQMGVDPPRHTASSAATLLYPEARYDMIRVGISLYGLWPSREIESRIKNQESWNKKFVLKPVLSWKTRIAQIKKVKKGETVGYDRTFRVERAGRIAILPVGYGDGYDRRFSINGEVLVGGARARVIGRVCMNMTMIDITDIKNAREGGEVVLLGKQKNEKMSAEELAKKIGTIHYEVVARINPLIARIIIHVP